MLYLHRIQHFHLGAVQILIDYRDFIPHNTIIHINRIAESIFRGKARCFPDNLSAGNHTSDNFISQHVFLRNVLGAQCKVYLVCASFSKRRRHIVRYCFHCARSVKRTVSALETVYSCVVTYIINRSGFLFKLPCIRPCLLIRSHSPAFKEVKNILLCRPAGQTHQILILISRESQRNTAGRRCSARISCVCIHPREEQVRKLLIVICVSLKIISSVISKVKLPVHTQLCKYIGSRTLSAGCHFVINIRVLETHTVIGILCLCQNGEIVVRYLRHRIGALVNTMANFMGNSPSKVYAALISSFRVGHHRNRRHHTGTGTPFDTNMIAGSVHKCS